MAVDEQGIPSFLGDELDRPLGAARLASNHANREISVATSQAADNLLAKAVRRLERGEDQEARAFVDRALGLPYDDYEGWSPAAWSAHMMLFLSISDDLGSCPAGDPSWLDRAEVVLDAATPAAATELRACLRAILDADTLTAAETRRLKALTRGVPLDADPLTGVPDAPEARAAAVLGVLAAVLHHRRTAAVAGI